MQAIGGPWAGEGVCTTTFPVVHDEAVYHLLKRKSGECTPRESVALDKEGGELLPRSSTLREGSREHRERAWNKKRRARDVKIFNIDKCANAQWQRAREISASKITAEESNEGDKVRYASEQKTARAS